MTRNCKLPGCDNPVSSRAECCSPAHRAANWRLEHVVKEVPQHPRAGKNARSGSQISFQKAVGVLAAWLYYHEAEDVDDADRTAELILRGALPERQQARERARTG